jgi:CHAT domain-containing protein
MDWPLFRERARALDPRVRVLTHGIPASTVPSNRDEALLDGEFMQTFAKLQAVSRTGQPDELPQLANVFLGLYERARNDRQRANAADAIARCNYESAGARIKAKDVEGAQAAFGKAAQWFAQAEDPAAAERCRDKALSAAADLHYELDPLLAEQLKNLSTALDPMRRIECLDALIESTIRTGDQFEALAIAQELAKALKDANLPDPQEVGVEVAVNSWIANAPAANRTEYVAGIFAALRAYTHILSVRIKAVLGKPDRVAPLERLFSQLALSGISDEAAHQDRLADDEISAEWNRTFPNAAKQSSAADQEIRKAEELNRALNGRRNAFEIEFNVIYDQNEARDYGVDREDLIRRVSQLEEDAGNLEYEFYRAKALELHGEILNYDRQLKTAIEVLDEARAVLKRLSPAGDFQGLTNAERGLYEVILRRKLDVLGQLGDNAAVSETSGEAIRSVESRRYQLSNPERQSAFMDWRASFYTYGIAAARHLGDWDKLLERMELVKARTLIRTSLSPDPPPSDDSDLQRRFAQVSGQLQAAGADAADLRRQRRQLWDLISMSRCQRQLQKEPPVINVANLQSALGEDEIAISYLAMTTGVFLAVVADRHRFDVERIALTEAQVADLNEFADGVQSIVEYTDGIEPALRSLGPLLLPESIRARMRDKSRVVFSPHAALHLVPFQAFPWEQSFLGLQFAVRYVPCLSALLLPFGPSGGSPVFTLGIKQFSTPPFDQHPLELAEEEACKVAEIYEAKNVPVRTLTGPAASRAALGQMRAHGELQHYGCLHLATHGTSVYAQETRDHPLESQIILQDGWIDGLEISELQLNADLVVLSACNSGQRAVAGRGLAELPADDVFGLQSAFIGSGVRAVLGALWPLGDEAGYEVTLRFHRQRSEGQAPDRALQLALIDYRAQFPENDGFFWAPWFLVTLGNGSVRTHNGKSDSAPSNR